ncbi:HNH endonuclease signature motif containing protein [Streptomyces ipomoeae]|uniref:HNH endonuclease signature motif containing protein n=1 Tax=Streptomyces ipomoeae TaxID=103232 RepID=UPI0038D44C9B
MPDDSRAPRRPLLLTEAEVEQFREFCLPPDDNGCVKWSGDLIKGGWGRFKVASRHHAVPAHHVAWQIAFGELPVDPELVIDHTCQVRDCVNVEHLEWVTQLENYRRIDLRRSTCRRGHDWHSQVAYFRFNSQVRICFVCEAEGPSKRKPSTRRKPRKADLARICPRGHDVSGDNGYDLPGLSGKRGCHTCTKSWRSAA